MLRKSFGLACVLMVLAYVLLAGSGSAVHSGVSVASASEAAAIPSDPSAAHPNILFILTDDQDVRLDSLDYMPHVKSLLTDKGIDFENFFVTVSLCCPSRSTIQRGQYAHNTQIYGNSYTAAHPDGGFQKFYKLGEENSTIGTWLHDAGYRTGLMGKYLNGYPQTFPPGQVPQNYIPPGWDEWDSPTEGQAKPDANCTYDGPYSEYNYWMNENGTIVPYKCAASDYMVDVLSGKANTFIQQAATDHKPFFLYLATYAPHQPATPAPRHENLFQGVTAPRPPSFNEPDVSDKPDYIKSRPLLTPTQVNAIDELYRNRLRSLQSVDEMVAHLVDTLQTTGQLDNTYIFFVSDNGFHMGEHRLNSGKQAPYEEDIRVPMIVRGPGVLSGVTRPHLTVNVDLAPTFADLAGVTPPAFVDGRSLVPLLHANPPGLNDWRCAVLLSHGDVDEAPLQTNSSLEPPDPMELEMQRPNAASAITPFAGLRTVTQTYVDYTTGERELYNLPTDPYELHNLVNTANPTHLTQLDDWLTRLSTCAGQSCRDIEGNSPWGACVGYRSFLPHVADGEGGSDGE
ncbi:MAG: sulfatase [Anaerolineae bacterium]